MASLSVVDLAASQGPVIGEVSSFSHLNPQAFRHNWPQIRTFFAAELYPDFAINYICEAQQEADIDRLLQLRTEFVQRVSAEDAIHENGYSAITLNVVQAYDKEYDWIL